MKTYSINFRNFNYVKAGFSYYANGNVCLEIYSGDVRLCELSKDMGYKISSNAIILRDTIHTNMFIKELMNSGLISAYNYHRSEIGTMYVCSLSHKIIRDLENIGTHFAMAGIV